MTRSSSRTSQARATAPADAADPHFPEEGFRFLAALKRNNDRDWFNARKDEYKSTVEQPMAELVRAVAAGCRARRLELFAKDKNPVMRVYRDIRFSKDKTPYKTHVAAELRRSFRNSQVVLYLHFSPSESLLAAGVWQPERPLLQAWREAIAEHPERFTSLVSKLKSRGLALSKEQTLTTMPRGYVQHADTPVGEYLKLTSFITVGNLEAKDCTRPGLLARILDFAVAAKPLLEFGWNIEASTSSADPLLLD